MNYSQAIRMAIKKGNYPLLFKVIPYTFIFLIVFNILLIAIDSRNSENRLILYRLVTSGVLVTGFSYFIHNRKVRFINILFYEILVAFCFLISQFITLFSTTSLWYLYSAVIIGGLFYGFLSGSFLMPFTVTPVLYYLSSELAVLFDTKHISDTFNNNPGVIIVIWFSAATASAVRLGFDVYYNLRVTLHEQALQLVNVKKLKESAEQNLLLEKELNKLKSVETLGLYAGGIAHDFNNMLTIIAGQMMSLRRSATDNFEKKSIESIMQAVKKTSGLIKKMLLFSGQYESNRKIFSLNENVESAIELISHGIDKKIDIRASISDDIAWIHGDPDLFQTSLIGFLLDLIKTSQIIGLDINLSEAGEYRSSSPGYFKPENILIRKLAILTINGELKITRDWQKNETFFELMSVVNAMNGKLITGLITGKEIVQIIFPLSMNNLSEPEHNINSNQNNRNILIIDDDKMVLKSTEEVLLSAGYTVISCNDASEAIKIFSGKYKEIGLVLLDMRMPEISGKELYFELKKIDSHVKVIIVSGYCSDIDVQEMLNDGALEYIEKPYSEDELCTKVALFI